MKSNKVELKGLYDFILDKTESRIEVAISGSHAPAWEPILVAKASRCGLLCSRVGTAFPLARGNEKKTYV